jgi:hypothetical protein
MPTTANPDSHDILVPARPFALHAEQLSADLEDEVVALVLSKRLQDRNSQLGCLSRDRQLGHVSLVVARLHEHMFACEVSQNKARLCRK